MSKRITTLAFALLSTIAWVGGAHGALINVQFGSPANFSGAAVIGTSGDFWNDRMTNTGSLALNDSTNTGSGVTLTSSSSAGIGDFGTPLGAPFNSTAYENLFRGVTVATAGSPVSINLSGLAAGTYDLYVLGAANYPDSLSPGVQARTLIASATTSVGTVGPLTVGPNNNASTLVQNTNWVLLQPVVGVNGLLTINGVTGGTGSGGEGVFSGFQLSPVAVPEPSGLALISIAALGFVAKLRRRS